MDRIQDVEPFRRARGGGPREGYLTYRAHDSAASVTTHGAGTYARQASQTQPMAAPALDTLHLLTNTMEHG